MTVQQVVMLALQASVILIVFGFGLQTTLHDLQYLLRRPGLLARSLLAMFVVMPIVALILVRAFELRPSFEIALVALAGSPRRGGVHGQQPSIRQGRTYQSRRENLFSSPRVRHQQSGQPFRTNPPTFGKR